MKLFIISLSAVLYLVLTSVFVYFMRINNDFPKTLEAFLNFSLYFLSFITLVLALGMAYIKAAEKKKQIKSKKS